MEKVVTKHQQLNSLVAQITEDGKRIHGIAACAAWFNDDDLKNMADAANAVLNHIAKYLELSK